MLKYSHQHPNYPQQDQLVTPNTLIHCCMHYKQLHCMCMTSNASLICHVKSKTTNKLQQKNYEKYETRDN